jgi:hypothetical protein
MRELGIAGLNLSDFSAASDLGMSANNWEGAATRRLVYGIGLLAAVAIIVGAIAFLSLAM